MIPSDEETGLLPQRPMFYQCRECGVDRDVALEDRDTLQDGAVICLKCFDEQSQAAASLRQRLRTLETAYHNATNERVASDAEVATLKAQLAQAQQERSDILERCVEVEDCLDGARDEMRLREARAFKAEAALEEMQKRLDGFDGWLNAEAAIVDSWHSHAGGQLKRAAAELQRRRSPRGQEKA